MKKIKLLTLCLTSLFLLCIAGQALAANPILPLFQNGANQASDEDREFLIDRNYNPDAVEGEEGYLGQLEIGDSFRGHISFNTLNDANANVGGTTGTNEWTGVLQAKLYDIIESPVPGGIGSIYVWGPDPDLWTVGSDWYDPNAVAGTGIVLYEDSALDFVGDFDDPTYGGALAAAHPYDDGTPDPPGNTVPPSSADVSTGGYDTEEAFIDTATNGTYWGSIGWDGWDDATQTWDASTYGAAVVTSAGFGNVLAAFGISSGTTGASSNFFLNLLHMNPYYDFYLNINRVMDNEAGGLVDFAFSQTLRGVEDLDTPFEISSNTNMSFNVTVIPEPTTFALFGLGLLGLAGIGRRRKKA